MKKVLVAGIGNVLLGDDGVGPLVTQWLSEQYLFSNEVEVADLGTPALDFIDHIEGLEALIVVDAVENDQPAGTVTLYRKDELMQNVSLVRMDTHSPAITESLVAAEVFFGRSPREVLLIGITGESYAANCTLSDPVREGASKAIAVVIEELARLGFSLLKKNPENLSCAAWKPVLAPLSA
jgi:hydrogenase maturation protease